MQTPSLKPVRTCLGCNGRDAYDAMVRITWRNGAVVIDPNRRMSGRGGYLHCERSCLAKFVRSKVKEFRSLRRGLSLDERRRIAELIQSAAG